MTWEETQVARMINQPTHAEGLDGTEMRNVILDAMANGTESEARTMLRFFFRTGQWHTFYFLDAKAAPDHPARTFLPRYMEILAAIESNPAIWRRCLDKAKAQPETLP